MRKGFLKLVYRVLLVLFCGNLHAQLSGTFNVPINYSTVAAAILDLNLQGVSGPVIINISAGYSETAPAGGYALTATGTSLNPITFRRIGIGANPLITAFSGGVGTPATANQDGVWRLVGSDFITIDGIDINDPNLTNPSTMEYGYGLFKLNAGNGCDHVTIQNCVVTLKRINNATGLGPAADGSRAINVVASLPGSQTTVLTPTSSSGTHSFNKFYNNTLQNCNIGIALMGYAAVSPFTLADTGNEIGSNSPLTGNSIINFGGATAATNPAAAIRTLAQYNISIVNNIINNNTGAGVNHVTALRGIYLNTATSANASVTGNTITLNSAATTAVLAAIENMSGATASNNTITISGNLISNCTYSANTSGSFYGIFNNAASSAYLEINNNVFSGFDTKATTGSNYLIYNTGAVTSVITVTNNLITSGTNSTSSSGIFYGIFNNVVSTAWLNMSSNTFSNVNSYASTGAVYAIYNSSAISNSITLKSNTLSACNHSVNSTGAYYGIYNNGSGTAELNVSLNSFLSNTLSMSGGSAFLLYNTAGVSNSILFNNNLILNSSTVFNSGGSYYSIYNNAASTTDLQMNNNTYSLNTSVATTGSVHVIYNRGALTNTFISASLNNNLIVSSTFSASSTSPFLGIYNSGVTCSGLSMSTNTISVNNWLSSTAARYLLYNSAQVNTTFDLNSNLISNCTGSLNTTGSFNGLLNIGNCGTLNMNNNTFTNSINLASSGSTYLLYNSGLVNAGVITMTNNSIASYTSIASSSGVFYGIYNTGSSFANLFINNTTYTNSFFSSSTGVVALINNNGVAATSINQINLSNNLIGNCSTSITSNGAFYGIYNTIASSQSLTLSNNVFTNYTHSAVNGANHLIYNSGALTSTYNAVAMDNNLISNCTFSASGAAGLYSIWNNGVRSINTSISSNTLINTNWYAATALNYWIANFGVSTVSASLNNNIFSSCTNTINTTGNFFGIYNNNTSTVSTGNFSANNNSFTGIARTASTGETHFINISGLTTNTYTSIDINNNLMSACSSSISAAGPFYGIYNNSSSTTSLSAVSNTFSNNYLGAFTGPTHVIYNRGVAGNLFSNVTISSNMISNITSSISSSGSFYGLFNSGAATTSCSILNMSNNTFTASNVLATSGSIYLIYSACPVNNSFTLNSNTLSAVSNTLTTSGAFYALSNWGNALSGDLNINNNILSNLNSAASTGIRYLIYNSGGISNNLNILNNFISTCNHTVSGNASYFGINNNSAFSGLSASINNNTLIANTTSLTTGSVNLILNSGVLTTTLANVSLNNNVIDSYTATASSGSFFGISNTGISAGNLSLNTNSITTIKIQASGSTQQLLMNSGRISNTLSISNNLVSAYSNTLNTTGSFYGINNSMAFANGNYPLTLTIGNNRFLTESLTSSTGAIYFINNTAVASNTILTCDISNNEISNQTHTITNSGTVYGISNSAVTFSNLGVTSNSLTNIASTTTSSVRYMIINAGSLLSNGNFSNNLVSDFTSTVNTSASYYGITNTGNSVGNLLISNNNFLNHSLAASTGSAIIVSNTGIISNSISITNNIFSNMTHSASTSGGYLGVYNSAGSSANLLVNANTFTNINVSTSTGATHFIFNRAAVTGTISLITITNNSVSVCSFSASSGPFYAAYNSGNSFGSMTIGNNAFVNIIPNSTAANRYFIYNTGLGLSSGSLTIQNNLMSSFNASLNTLGNFYGIYNQGNTLGYLGILTNSLTNLNLSASNGLSYMIYNSGTVGACDLNNNLISAITNSCTGTGAYFGVFNQASTSSALSVNNNTFNSCSLFVPSASSYLIYNNGVATNTISSVSLSNNSVSNFSLQSNSGTFYGIYNNLLSSGTLSINNNSFLNAIVSTTSSSRYLLNNSGQVLGDLNLSGNNFSNFTSTLNTTGSFLGLYNTGNCLGSANINNNIFLNHTLSSSSGSVLMVYNSGVITNSITITNNNVSNLSNTGSAASFFYGIYNNAASSSYLNISSNTFTNITHGTTTGSIHFIYNRGLSTNTISTITVTNNVLSAFTFTASSGPFYAFYNNATAFANLSVSGNTFASISSTTTSSPRFFIYNTGIGSSAFNAVSNVISNFTGTTNTTGSYNGINNGANIFGNLSITNNIFSNQFLSATTASAFVIYNSGTISNSISIGSNSVSNLTHSASTTGGFLGIHNNAGSSANLNISSNNFTNIALNSNSGPAHFIYNRASVAGTIAAITVSNNSLSAFSFTTASGPFYGIYNNGLAFSNLSILGNSFATIATTGSTSPRYFILNNAVGSSAIAISNNQVTGFTSTLNTTGAFYDVLNSGACNGNLIIDNNNFTNQNLSATTATVYGIHNSANITNSISISNNAINGLNHSSTTGYYYGLINTSASAALVVLSTNSLSNINITNSVSPKYLIYNTAGSSSVIQFTGNVISNYSNTINAGGTHFVIYNTGSSAGDLNVSNNTLSNFLVGSSAAPAYLIYNTGSNSSASGALKFNNNNLAGIGYTSASGLFYGLYNTGASNGSLSFSNNNFTNSSLNTSTSNRYIIHNTGAVNANMSYTNNLISINTSSVNTSGAFYGIYNLGTCQGSLSMSSNTLSNNFLETSTGITYMIANTASVNSGIKMDNNSVSNYSNSTATSGDFNGIMNGGSGSPFLSMNANSFSNNTSAATSGNTQLLSNTGTISNSITISGNNLSHAFNNAVTDNSGNFNAIYNAGGALTSSVNIANNNFSNFQFNGVSGTGNLYFIQNSNNNAQLNVLNNTWTNLNLNHNGNEHLIYNPSSTQASLSVINNSVTGGYTRSGTAGAIFIYYSNGNSPASCTQNFSNNNFSNFTANTQGTGSFYGLYSSDGLSSPFPKKLVYNNVISNINYNGLGFMYAYYFDFLGDGTTTSGSAIYNNTVSTISWGGPFYGVYSGTNVSPNYAAAIYSNAVLNAGSNGQNADMYGAYLNGSASGVNFYKNKISDIAASGSAGASSGIYINGTGTVTLSNNLVGNLFTPFSSVVNSLNGIYIAGGNLVNAYYNTILLNATSTGSNFASNALYALTNVNVNLQNNIFINTSVANGAGITTAYRRSSTSLSNYVSTSNNNVFYAGVPAFNRVLLHDGTNGYLTLPAFQVLVSPRENLSVSENSPMLSTTGTNSNFLHINSTIPSLTDNGAASAGSVNSDYDAQIRQGNSGYVGVGTAPDIGADEYDPNLSPCLSANAGTVIIPSSTVKCSGETIYMLSSGYTAAGGIVHQWKVSTTPGGPYTNVNGGVGANYVAYTTATLNAGVYYYVLVTTCTIGSLSGTSNEVTVTVNQTPTVSASVSNQMLCAGQDIHLIASGSNGSAYSWLGPNNFTSSVQNPTVSNASTTSGGVYTLLVSGSNCTSSPVYVTATINPSPPAFSLTPAASSLCAGSSQTIGASIPVTNPTLNFGSQTYQNSASAYPAPYSVYYGGQKMQMLVLAGELAAAGFTTGSPIASLQFSVNALGANWGNTLADCKDFKIAIKSTTTSVLTTFETGLTGVLGPINYTPVVGAGNIHAFSAPFIWDGSSNVVIETVFSNSIIGTAANTVIHNNSPTGFQSTLVYRADNQNITTVSAATTSNVNVGFVRPDFILNGAQVGTYSWSPSTGLSATNTTTVIASPTLTTIYTASLSNGQCASTSSMLLNVILTPTVTIATTSSLVCLGNNATLTAGGAATYTWSTNSTATTIVVSPFIGTTYTLTGSNPACPNASNTIFIQSAPAMVLSTSMVPATLCQGQSATISVSGANSYTWTGGSNATSITVTPSLTTNYIVNGSNGPGCWANKVVLAKVNPIPFISITPSSATICPGQTITLEASGVFSFTWAPGSSNSPIIEVSPVVTTVYSVIGVDLNACVNTTSATITVDPCVSIAESKSSDFGIEIYPNPSNGLFTVDFNFHGIKSIVVVNALGSCIYTLESTDLKEVINLSQFGKGIYFVKINTTKTDLIKKIIID